MKIYFNGYKHNWISPYTILEKFFFWRKGYDAYRKDPPKWLTSVCRGWVKIADFFNPEIRYVKIDRYDVWDMNSTLATIILPMLIEFKRQLKGAPFVEDEDVPYGLRSFNCKPKENEWDTDEFHFMRWEWIIDELIWTFTALHPDTDYEDNYHAGHIDLLWLPVPDRDDVVEMVSGPKGNHRYDIEGHKEHEKRIQNGLRLFAKYYRGLWS